MPFPRSARHFVPSGDTKGGAIFLIRSPCSPISYSPRHAPFSLAHSFRRLVVPSRPSSRRAYRNSSSHPSFYSSWVSGIRYGAGATAFYVTHFFLFNIPDVKSEKITLHTRIAATVHRSIPAPFSQAHYNEAIRPNPVPPDVSMRTAPRNGAIDDMRKRIGSRQPGMRKATRSWQALGERGTATAEN